MRQAGATQADNRIYKVNRKEYALMTFDKQYLIDKAMLKRMFDAFNVFFNIR